MWGGGSSGGSGGFTAGLLSVFLLVSFLWVLGEELEELLELVTVSPELHATRDVCSLQLPLTRLKTIVCMNIFYIFLKKISITHEAVNCTCFLDI